MILKINEYAGSKKLELEVPISEVSYVGHMTHDDYHDCDKYYVYLKSGKCLSVNKEIVDVVEKYWNDFL